MNKTLLPGLIAALLLFAGRTDSARGYAFETNPTDSKPLSWPDGSVTMNLQLSPATVPFPDSETVLKDGSASWTEVAQAALAEWNPYLSSVQFVSNTTSLVPAQRDGVNSVFFSSTAFGQGFGSDALAVTLITYHVSTDKIAETDVVVNTAYEWDSYRGNQVYDYTTNMDRTDLRRVLDHEFGHVLGLDHPDQAGQSVTAIMNSTISNLDHIEVDDVEGAMSLYGQKAALVPVVASASPTAGGTITGTGNFQVGSTQQITAVPAPGYVFVQWEDRSTNPTRSVSVPVQGPGYTATFELAIVDLVSRYTYQDASIYVSTFLFARNQFYVFADNSITSPQSYLNYTGTSTDGVTWTQTATSSTSIRPGSIAYGNGIFLHADGYPSHIFTSTDAKTWTLSASLVNSGLVAYGNGLFVTTEPYSSSTPSHVLTSSDGVNWSPVAVIANGDGVQFSSIVYGNGRFVMVGVDVTASTYFTMASTDGKNWSLSRQIANVQTEHYYGQEPDGMIAYGNGRFVISMHLGSSLMSSADGLTWATCTAPGPFSYPDDVTDVAYGNGYFVAGTEDVNGEFFSTDGMSWSRLITAVPIAGPLTTVGHFGGEAVFGNGVFVASGGNLINQSGPVVPAVTLPVLPVIGGNAYVRVTPGASLNYQIVADNAPYAYNVLGLPDGLSVNQQTGVISGTPTGSGRFPVTQVATNDAGSALATLTIDVAPPPAPVTFGTWATANNVTGGMSDTPRGDSVPNLLKYFFDIDPTVPMTTAARASLPVFATASSGTQLTLKYPENKILENVGVTVETSTDMVSWSTPSGWSITPTGELNGNGDQIMVAQVPVTAGTQFIRLVVTPQ